MTSLLAAALVLLSSAAVLVLEVLVSRLVAPYVGLTLETYTASIGVALGAIAAGAALGGRLADAVDPRRWLGPALALGGALLLLARPTVFAPRPRPARRRRGRDRPARRRRRRPGRAGAVDGDAGRGQAAAAHARRDGRDRRPAVRAGHARRARRHLPHRLRPAVGAARLPGAARRRRAARRARAGARRRAARAAAGPAAGAGALGALGLAGLLAAGLLVVADGSLRARDPVLLRRASSPTRPAPSGRTLVLDGLQHSYVDLADPAHLEFSYTQRFGDVLATLPPGPLEVLHLGLGGGTLPRHLAQVRPGSAAAPCSRSTRACSRSTASGSAWSPGPTCRCVVGDARTSIAAQPAAVLRRGGRRRLRQPRGAVAPHHPRDGGRGAAGAAAGRHVPAQRHRQPAERLRRAPRRRRWSRRSATSSRWARPRSAAGRVGGNFVLAASDRPLPREDLRRRAEQRGSGDEAWDARELAGDAAGPHRRRRAGRPAAHARTRRPDARPVPRPAVVDALPQGAAPPTSEA